MRDSSLFLRWDEMTEMEGQSQIYLGISCPVNSLNIELGIVFMWMSPIAVASMCTILQKNNFEISTTANFEFHPSYNKECEQWEPISSEKNEIQYLRLLKLPLHRLPKNECEQVSDLVRLL